MIKLKLTFGKDQEAIIDDILETKETRVFFYKKNGTVSGMVTYDMEWESVNDIYVLSKYTTRLIQGQVNEKSI